MIRSHPFPGAGAGLAHMLEERRRLRRQLVLLEGAVAELRRELQAAASEKRRQESSSGWCGPDLARRVEVLCDRLAEARRHLLQVQAAIEVTSDEVDRRLQNRWLEGRLAARAAAPAHNRLTARRRHG